MSNYFKPSAEFSQSSHIVSMEQYQSLYDESIKGPEGFWEKIANRISWSRKWYSVREFDFVEGKIKWFDGAKLNASYNCLDRHIENGHGAQKALIWEGIINSG